jgi:hypothetical protein
MTYRAVFDLDPAEVKALGLDSAEDIADHIDEHGVHEVCSLLWKTLRVEEVPEPDE